MKATLTFCLLILGITFSSATNYIVNNSTDWDAVPITLPAGDTVFIQEGAVIANMTVAGRSILGTIVNYGDFTVNAPSGLALQMMGSIINYGNFTIGNAGVAWFGVFINVGTLNINLAALVIQGGGSLLNTGVINNNVDLLNLGNFSDCGTFNGNSPNPGGIPANSLVPVDTPCDDMDDATINDVIVDVNCTCQGELIVIPTLSQWGIIGLSIVMLIFGIVAVRQRKVILG